ncbi:hypothetical protein IW261DRAFT_1550690 [Armillaria novae-zelandiae]|uniref:ATP-dependent RNA helicase SUB2 n=1 Tax=Armillaria novae-zelandiae TaxID=153914 RepID=A0AA39PCC4_9AGAR|nr:hypothetical protein IW261DRAFT_1550690 [Armillaria novae-zelandiae]
MSANDNEDLIDYEDEHDIVPNGSAAAAATNGAATGGAAADGDDKKNFSGIHSTGFRDFLLKPELLRAISDLGFEHPSEVQQECIPQAVLGMDVLCQAKSGHGKTAVFVLATLQQLEAVNGQISVLVLCHTRELAFQIKNEYTRFAKYMPEVRVSTFYGGTPVSKDAETLRDKNKCPHIVVATPGRLNALARDKVLDAKNVKHFVLDECDKMLEQLDMRRDVQEIFRATPHHKQVMMFSATLAKDIRVTCKKFMANPLEIFVDDETKLTLHGLQQHYVKLEESGKNRKLNDLLDTLEFNQVVIFVKSVARAIELDKLLVSCNFPSISIHSGLQQEERINRYSAFKAFEKRILVATDIFGRGIDVERVNIVVNYDCPPDADSYLHRVGRAGRFGTKGLAVSFVSSDSDQQVLESIQSRFEVAIPELPDHIDPASYSDMTYLAEGSSLKDSSNVLAKISPAQSNGSMCLEREAHILGRMALSSDNPALRMIDFINIPKENGDVVILLLFHPGPNLLGRYLPPSKINELLLADMSRVRPSSSHGDIYMLGIEEPDFTEEMEAFDIMDLASFLEYVRSLLTAVSLPQVRANAFHLNAHSGNVRFVHFGNRAISLEKSGSPSSLVLKAFDESEKVKVKEALCYLAPEQTGSIETTTQDHRTDLYSLGIMFWTLLVGRGQMPFEGGPLELLHSIVQKRPMPVHDVRRDVPQVLASIIDKLLAKHPDSRYQSAYGLKTDLIECQRRLLVSLIPHFDIALQDRFMVCEQPFFGRDKELELVRNVIRNTSTSFSRHFSASKGYISISSSGSQGTGTGNGEDRTDSRSSSGISSKSNVMNTEVARSVSRSTLHDQSSVSASITSSLQTSDGLLRTSLRSRPRTARAQVVVVAGCSAHGLWGHAKFQNVDSAPFSALLSCLSSVLRQLMVFHTDVHRFVTALKERLGPQIQNVPLLYQGTPELRDVLALLDIHVDTPKERLTLDLVSSFINSKSRMLIFATIRDVVERVRSMFSSRSKPTWITLEPLSYNAISTLVSKTLHRAKEECAPLSRVIYSASSGNAFSARSILNTFHRHNFITFNWERNSWQYDMAAIESSLDTEKTLDPTDLTFLLPEEARKYLIWAALFGESFKVTEVALMMHLEDASGLQKALDEGWLIQRARDMCSFAHDRYRQAAQAEAANLPEDVAAKMSFRMSTGLRSMPSGKCLSLLQDHPKRDELLSVLIEAGEAAWTRGAHELAIRSFHSARTLLRGDPWSEYPQRTFQLFSRNYVTSNELVQDCMLHAQRPEQTAYLLRLRSRNHWMRGNFTDALNDNLLALKILGVEIDPAPTRRKADRMFEEVKNEILAVGFDEILSIPRTTDPRHLLAVELLNDAGTNAYWSTSPAFSDVIGLTTIQQALRNGMAPGTALGFFWALGGAAEQRELYRFSADLARLALRIAERHGSSSEKCRAQVLYCSMVSGYDSMHISTMIPRLEEAIQYGNSAGDRVYTAFARVHAIITRLFVCEHINELVTAAEDCVNEVKQAASGADMIALAQRGYTYARSADTAFDTDAFNEAEYLTQLREQSGNPTLAFSWYNSFKIVGFYCLGFFDEAAELGFSLYDTRDRHPNHRHVRYGLFFHSLAMISSMRKRSVTEETRIRYLKQIESNQRFIKKWLSPSPVNTSTWVALVDAELSSLLNKPSANKQYDTAVKLAVNHDWLLEEGWGLYLVCFFLLALLLLSPWFSKGVISCAPALKGWEANYNAAELSQYSGGKPASTKTAMSDEQESTLSASDLASILKWSKDISSDINLSSALQRLTEIATETSGSQNTCVVITREDGDYTVATSMTPPEQCQVYEYARQTVYRSVICLPIFSNRGQTFGTVYVSSKYSFSQNIVIMLTLLCQQASISISNALLFRSVQASTRENLKMIAAQRDALETARKSREDALKATKIKSNFLASMSHELRTPFSSFYGLLDLLSGTELNPGQSEIEASALKLEPCGFLVEDCMELLLPVAAKKLDLSFNIEPDVPPFLMNLIGNAVKFTEKGYVQVSCSVANPASVSSSDEVNIKFVIQDSGIGLSPSDVELLFVPFQQADNSSTRRFGGTGLGLSISRQLVKLMNGAIGVQSELHAGSMFWFTIPVKIFHSEESNRASSLQQPQILVISGSRVTLALLDTFFTGFTVTPISSLQDAEMFLRNFSNLHAPLDFIILDDQSDEHANDLAQFLRSLHVSALQDTKIIHLYTPTTNLSRQSIFGTSTPGVVKMTKPPRQARLLQTLAGLKNLPNAIPSVSSTEVSKAVQNVAAAQRTLYGNVLIAEDNPIAQQLLVKQLQRYQLNVTATSNGNEAISEWESRDPGHFTVALFDHRKWPDLISLLSMFGPSLPVT